MNRKLFTIVCLISIVTAFLLAGTLTAFVFLSIHYPLIGLFCWLFMLLTIVCLVIATPQMAAIEQVLLSKKNLKQKEETENE